MPVWSSPILALLTPPPAVEDAAEVDSLFLIFALVSVVALLLVHGALGIALLRRRRSEGNRRRGRIVVGTLAMVALAGLVTMFVVSEEGWEALKLGRNTVEGTPQRALVVGQRFAWSVVYPGPDGELGAYLHFPKAGDAAWPNPLIVDAVTAAEPPAYTFRGVAGPADLPADEVDAAITAYREQVNPLGKDFTDPLGWDDDWRGALGRPLELTVNRPVEVRLGSVDVIHDFFVPAMRVKLDAVPGLLGTVRFTPTETGRFQLLCAEFCGWGHTTMIGEVVVTEGDS